MLIKAELEQNSASVRKCFQGKKNSSTKETLFLKSAKNDCPNASNSYCGSGICGVYYVYAFITGVGMKE